jgi:sec-independent protein translocase protein TatA
MAGLDNPLHLMFLLVLVLLLFGAKRLPEMGRSLGSGMRGFKDALSTDVSEQRALERQVPATGDSHVPSAPQAGGEVSPRSS